MSLAVPRPEVERSIRRLAWLLVYQDGLLRDARRNRAFTRALEQRVKPGSNVLDLGAGTGVWAVMAARLGARRVVAVERERLLAPVIERTARDNGVADRVEVVTGDGLRLHLEREFDVVVSETIGPRAFDEGIVPLMARAARRFLRPGGAMIPERVSLWAAPVKWSVAPPAPPVAVPSFDALVCHVARQVVGTSIQPVARAAKLLEARLGTEQRTPAVDGLQAEWSVRDVGQVAGVATWTRLRLAPGLSLDTRRATNWTPTFCSLESLGAGPGRLSFRVSLGPRSRWDATFTPDVGRPSSAAFDPVFAYAALRRRPRTF